MGCDYIFLHSRMRYQNFENRSLNNTGFKGRKDNGTKVCLALFPIRVILREWDAFCWFKCESATGETGTNRMDPSAGVFGEGFNLALNVFGLGIAGVLADGTPSPFQFSQALNAFD